MEQSGKEESKVAMGQEKITVNISQLSSMDGREDFFSYVKSVYLRREFIKVDAQYRSFRTAKDYKLWQFWLVAQPLLDALLYGLVFGVLLMTSRGVENYVGFLVIGIVFFNYMSKLVQAGSGLIRNSLNIIRAFSFPCATLVISLTLRYLIDTLPAMAVAVVFGALTSLDYYPNIEFLCVLPLIFLMTIFGSGLLFFVARLSAFIPDIRVIVEVFVKAWLFISGVFFSLERFATHPVVFEVMSHNPGYMFLTSLRNCILYAKAPTWGEWFALTMISLGTFLAGFVFFWLAEERYAKI